MPHTVLVADDSATARMIIKRCLQIAGCRNSTFLEADSGIQALELATSHGVDLLVTDLNMPNMDGKTLLRRIKASPKLNSLPVLVISSASNQAKESELLSDGAFAVLSKPVLPASVAKKLQDLDQKREWGY
ncbi:response regulator [bacterium]|nr:response regulator [bacterium]